MPDSLQMPPGIIATRLSIANFSIQESQIRCHSPLPKRENRRKSSSSDHPSVSSVSSYTLSVVRRLPFRLFRFLLRPLCRPHHLRFLITTNPAIGLSLMRCRTKLKKLYCDISHLETKLLADSGEPQDENRIVIKGGQLAGAGEEKARLKNLIEDHKRYAHPFVFLSDLYHLNSFGCFLSLSEVMINLFEIFLTSSVPASLRNML